MQAVKKAFIFGFLLWLIPFLISVVLFPFKKPEPVLYQTIMFLIGTTMCILFSVLYFRKNNGNIREGLFLGLVFLGVNLFFDFIFFIRGPIKMPTDIYIKEIGISYLINPIITISFGYLLGRSQKPVMSQ